MINVAVWVVEFSNGGGGDKIRNNLSNFAPPPENPTTRISINDQSQKKCYVSMLSLKSFIYIYYFFSFIKVVDSSLEYASLLPVSGDLMPDDELDIATASTLPSLTFQAAASNQAEDYDDQDEFLPSEARQTASIALTSDIYPSLDKHESEESEEDEFAASLMAVAAKGAYKKYIILLSVY